MITDPNYYFRTNTNMTGAGWTQQQSYFQDLMRRWKGGEKLNGTEIAAVQKWLNGGYGNGLAQVGPMGSM